MNITVNGYDLSPTVISGVTEGTNANERLTFTFDDSWNGLIKTITFYTPDRDVVCLVAEDTVFLPAEVTEQSGVTRYVICGTDGEKTVMSAEGAVRVSDTLNLDDDTLERSNPGAIETITRFIKKTTDAYDAAYANAQNAEQMADSAENAAKDAAASLNGAKTAQANAENYASQAAQSALEAKKRSEEVALDTEYLEENLSAHFERTGDFILENDSSSLPEPGKIYIFEKDYTEPESRFIKKIFLCSQASMYYAWKDGGTLVYTLSDTPAGNDDVYISENIYSIESRGNVISYDEDGNLIVYCDGETHTCRRMSGYDRRFGAYLWEKINEYKPIKKIAVSTLSEDSGEISLNVNSDNKGFCLSEFYARIGFKHASGETVDYPIEFSVPGASNPLLIPVDSLSDGSYIIHGEAAEDALFISLCPEADSSGGKESIISASLERGISSFQISRQGSVPLGAGTSVEIWGRYV